MARALGRHRSTICREFHRNCSRADSHYRPSKAQERTNGRRSSLAPSTSVHTPGPSARPSN
ncbi:MAG: hypothetical protein DMF68_04340, partial [Acidobacteria bacterium]